MLLKQWLNDLKLSKVFRPSSKYVISKRVESGWECGVGEDVDIKVCFISVLIDVFLRC